MAIWVCDYIKWVIEKLTLKLIIFKINWNILKE